jgi:predicted lysophospholipase L1 biosynthesis ABC-type transport system permease subunit
VFLGLLEFVWRPLARAPFLPSGFGDSLPAKMTYTVSASTVLQTALGLAISVLFSILPLLQIRDTSPGCCFVTKQRCRRPTRPIEMDCRGLSILALLGLAVWQAGS